MRVASKKLCKSGKLRNRSSAYCKKSVRACKSNEVRDRSSGLCRKRKSPKKSVRACKSNEVRDRSSGLCRKRLNSKKLSANAYTITNTRISKALEDFF